MIPSEILKRIRAIEIKTRRVVNSTFSGEYHSVFKGQGMSFAEVKDYHPGDDIRLIDWNVTAKMQSPFIKVFEEERELTVMLMVDLSGSGDFGTSEKTKVETFKLKKGEMIVFPSHTWHKVNKVTKGIRKTLVGWVVGSQWK